jgi:hypothetical protein
MRFVPYDDPRLVSSIALIEKPFAPDEYLQEGNKPLPLADKIVVLGSVTGGGNQWRIKVARDTPTAVFNDPLQQAIQELTGKKLPVLSPKDPSTSIKFQNDHALSPIGGNAILWVNNRLCVLRRDAGAPAASMPDHLMFAGGFWGGGALGQVPLKELQEEMRLVRVESLDEQRQAQILVYNFNLFSNEQSSPPPQLSDRDYQNIANSLTRWHGIQKVTQLTSASMVLSPRPESKVPLSTITVNVDGQERGFFDAWAGWEMYKGDVGGRMFDGPMNVFTTTQIFDAHVDGTLAKHQPALTLHRHNAKVGQIIVVDAEAFGRAGGAIRPEDVDPEDKLLPTVRGYLRLT